MKWFNDIKITGKLLISFTLVSILLAVVGYIGWNNMKEINDRMTTMYEENLLPLDQIANIQSTILSIRGDMWEATAVSDTVTKNNVLQQIDGKLALVNEGLEQYYARQITVQEKKLIDELNPALQEYEDVIKQYGQIVISGASTEDKINFLNNTVGGKRQATEDILETLANLHKENADKGDEISDNIYANTSRGIVILTVFAFLFSIALGIFIGRQITIPLNRAVQLAVTFAGGDLTAEVTEDSLQRSDEIGLLAKSLNEMAQKSRRLIEQIIIGSQENASLSEELSATTQDVSATMEEITASVEEISSGLETISATTEEINASSEEMTAALTQLTSESQNGTEISKEIESRAKEVSNHADEANIQAANLYGDIKEKLNKAIDDAGIITEVSALVDAIAGIASQTNLLALNAAIEAARAGEKGKGFAVVADEVRKLAEESSAIASDIKQLTENVQSAINNLVENTNEILQFVNDTVVKDYRGMVETGERYADDANTYFELNQKITAMSNQVLSSVKEVSRAIEAVALTMSDGTQGAEEIARGCENTSGAIIQVAESSAKLAENADRLNQLVTEFVV